MHDCSEPSARAVLLRPEPSRCLLAWWIGLHAVVATALLMTNSAPALGALPLLAWHGLARRPRRRSPAGSLLLIAGGRILRPAALRPDIAAGPGSRAGRFIVELEFAGERPARELILRDQLDARDWRRLRLAIIAMA